MSFKFFSTFVYYLQKKKKISKTYKLQPRKDRRLDFAAMDEFMDFILGAIEDHGSTAVRVFPPASHVLLLFSERLSSEVVSGMGEACLARRPPLSTCFSFILSVFSDGSFNFVGWGIYNHPSWLC